MRLGIRAAAFALTTLASTWALAHEGSARRRASG